MTPGTGNLLITAGNTQYAGRIVDGNFVLIRGY